MFICCFQIQTIDAITYLPLNYDLLIKPLQWKYNYISRI